MITERFIISNKSGTINREIPNNICLDHALFQSLFNNQAVI